MSKAFDRLSPPKRNGELHPKNLWTSSSGSWSSPLTVVTQDAISRAAGTATPSGAHNLQAALSSFEVTVAEHMLSQTLD